LKVRVYYEDTDAGGIVYHTNYIKYCERARSEIFFGRGMMPGEENRNGFVVRDLNAQFLSTAKLGDLLEIKTQTLEIKKTSATLLQEIFKEGMKIFSMEVLVVYVEEGKPRRIPETYSEVFHQV
jgi:acyl-CoA thioester hydrolase